VTKKELAASSHAVAAARHDVTGLFKDPWPSVQTSPAAGPRGEWTCPPTDGDPRPEMNYDRVSPGQNEAGLARRRCDENAKRLLNAGAAKTTAAAAAADLVMLGCPADHKQAAGIDGAHDGRRIADDDAIRNRYRQRATTEDKLNRLPRIFERQRCQGRPSHNN
jgi:hypothetical protein